MYFNKIIGNAFISYCGTIGGIHFCGCGCGCKWVLVRWLHKAIAREISHDTRRRRGKARSQASQQKRAVNRREQRNTVSRREQSTEVGVDQRERMSQRSWWLCWNFARIHAYDSPQMYRKLHKSVTNFAFLVLIANPSPSLFSFFPLTRLYILSFVCL